MGMCFQSTCGKEKPAKNTATFTIQNGFVWLVGRHDPNIGKKGFENWHIQGIASDEKTAVEMCADENYFVGPLPVDAALTHEYIEWVGCYFPLKDNMHKEQ